MSIWCSLPTIGHDPDGSVFSDGGDVRSYCDGWSNHYPTTDGEVERDAFIHLANMPPWCVPGREEYDYPGGFLGPWLRLAVESWEHNHPNGPVERISATVVMDEEAVRALHGQLSDWLDWEHIHPPIGHTS